ncbi:MAG: NTP transferase domain-containing protein [Deltaproteobacteria bacterium]|nr:NTP transferase domain-containing protein [Deltaproteobacteria bacterium]
MKAVIIAAGCGSRLIEKHQGLPKSLLEISGKRIIDDIISKIYRCGIPHIIVVTGFKHELLESGLDNYRQTGIKIEFVYNPEWRKANGISIYCAKKKISPNEEFILLMSDHIFDRQMLNTIANTKIGPTEAVLALDFKIDRIPDLDDGMKVQCTRRDNELFEIHRFGKKLNRYSAIDTGIFKFNYGFFKTLEETIRAGKDSLSDSCNTLSQKGDMLGLDIGEQLWLDIDTPSMMAEKEIIDEIFL